MPGEWTSVSGAAGSVGAGKCGEVVDQTASRGEVAAAVLHLLVAANSIALSVVVDDDDDDVVVVVVVAAAAV